MNPGKVLTDNDVANLAKIAALRGHIGALRAHIREARDQSAPGTVVESLLKYALELQVPETEGR